MCVSVRVAREYKSIVNLLGLQVFCSNSSKKKSEREFLMVEQGKYKKMYKRKTIEH